MRKIFLTATLLLFTSLMFAVTLQWCPSPDASVTGYKLYYGAGNVTNWQPQVVVYPDTNTPCVFTIVSHGSNWFRQYTNSINVGNTYRVTINNTNFSIGITYYFASTAYDASGVESELSNEERFTPTNSPPINPRPTAPTDFKLFNVK